MAGVLHTVALASWLWIAKKKLIGSYMCHSISGKRPCTTFHGVSIAAFIQMHIPGKYSCGPKSLSAHECLPRTLRYCQQNVINNDLLYM